MTEEHARSRPSIPVIISTWLKKWEQQIEEEDLQLQTGDLMSVSKATTATTSSREMITKKGPSLLYQQEYCAEDEREQEEPDGKTRRVKANQHVEQE